MMQLTVTFADTVTINGTIVPAGKYVFFTNPYKKGGRSSLTGEQLEERFINEQIKADIYDKLSAKFRKERWNLILSQILPSSFWILKD